MGGFIVFCSTLSIGVIFFPFGISYVFDILLEGQSFPLSAFFVDLNVAKTINYDNFIVLNPKDIMAHDRFYFFFPPFYEVGTSKNILDLFRWLHFRTCITDQIYLVMFDEIFRARFGGLSPLSAMEVFNNRTWTIEQLYWFKGMGKGFVSEEEFLRFLQENASGYSQYPLEMRKVASLLCKHASSNYSK